MPRLARRSAAPDPERLVKLALRERPVARRDRGEDLGVELDLPQRYVIVNTKVNLHGDRAHLH